MRTKKNISKQHSVKNVEVHNDFAFVILFSTQNKWMITQQKPNNNNKNTHKKTIPTDRHREKCCGNIC